MTNMPALPKDDELLPVRLGAFSLEWLLRNERWQAVMIPGLTFPLPKAAIDALQQVLDALNAHLTRDPAISAETIVQFSQLHVGGCAKLMSDRGRAWQPRMGLGVFPDQPPPTLWTAKDFEVMPEPTMKVRPLMNTVLRVGAAKNVQEEVAAECLVSGGIVRVYSEDFRAFLRKSKDGLLPRLQGSSFQGFLFYFPLLNAASFRGAPDEQLDQWLPGVSAYIAECPQEEALVLAFRGDLPYLLRLLQEQLRLAAVE